MTHAYVSTFHFLYGSREKRLNIIKTSWQLGSSPFSHLTLRQRHCQLLPWLFQAASPSSARPGVTCGRNPCQENTSLSRHQQMDPSPVLGARRFVFHKHICVPSLGQIWAETMWSFVLAFGVLQIFLPRTYRAAGEVPQQIQNNLGCDSQHWGISGGLELRRNSRIIDS